MDKTRITYDILNNGYMIKLDGKNWIEQVGENSKPMDSAKTFEENCLLQIEDLTKEIAEEIPEIELVKTDIEDLKAKDLENKVALAQVFELVVAN